MDRRHIHTKRMNTFGKFIKTFMVLYNIIIMIAGITICTLSGWMILGKSYLENLIGHHIYIGLLYLLLIAASLVVLISFIGCYGAAYEVRWMLYLYGSILLVMFLVLFTTCVAGLIERERTVKMIKNSLILSVKLYSSKDNIKYAWDEIQPCFKCCGVDSYKDWNGSVPLSCCKVYSEGMAPLCDENVPETIYQVGCYTLLAEFVSSHVMYISIIGLTIGLLKIIGMSFSFALANIIKQCHMELEI